MGSGVAPKPNVLEATPGLEPGIEVLQTSALPLGHVAAMREGRAGPSRLAFPPLGAEDEIRTRDPLLGKEMLYH